MFGVTGAGMSSLKYHANGKKRARRSLDQWDRVCTSSHLLAEKSVQLANYFAAKYDHPTTVPKPRLRGHARQNPNSFLRYTDR